MQSNKLVALVFSLLPLSSFAQISPTATPLSPTATLLSPTAAWAADVETQYNVLPNVAYTTENGIEMHLDIYSRRDVTTPQPTLIFMHGGFWVVGSKDSQITALLPWLEL